MTNDFIGQIKQVFILTELEITAGVSIQFYFYKEHLHNEKLQLFKQE